MRLGKYGKILHHDRVQLGEGHIDRFTIFEFKPLGSIILNRFNTIRQDRFHTHAFNAWSWMIKGHYQEEIVEEIVGKTGIITRREWRTRKPFSFIHLPRSLNHKIMKSSPNAWSITFCGPWKKTWTETDSQGNVRMMTWGRTKFEADIQK